jgi:hypothetical protein
MCINFGLKRDNSGMILFYCKEKDELKNGCDFAGNCPKFKSKITYSFDDYEKLDRIKND